MIVNRSVYMGNEWEILSRKGTNSDVPRQRYAHNLFLKILFMEFKYDNTDRFTEEKSRRKVISNILYTYVSA